MRRGLGRAGDIEGGTTALLAASAIRTADFGDDVTGCLPPVPWRVTEADLAARRDLRCGRARARLPGMCPAHHRPRPRTPSHHQ